MSILGGLAGPGEVRCEHRSPAGEPGYPVLVFEGLTVVTSREHLRRLAAAIAFYLEAYPDPAAGAEEGGDAWTRIGADRDSH